jgi:hypothetical protein
MMVAHHEGMGSCSVGSTERLFDASSYLDAGPDGAWHSYDVAPDGRIAMIRVIPAERLSRLVIVQPFLEELRDLR